MQLPRDFSRNYLSTFSYILPQAQGIDFGSTAYSTYRKRLYCSSLIYLFHNFFDKIICSCFLSSIEFAFLHKHMCVI